MTKRDQHPRPTHARITTAPWIIKFAAKQYDLPYRNAGKPIILLGIAFAQASRNISDWLRE